MPNSSSEKYTGTVGIVSEHLVGLIAKQIEESRLVVWYDPGEDYRANRKQGVSKAARLG